MNHHYFSPWRSKIVALFSFVFGIALLIYTWKPILDWHFFAKEALAKKSITFLSPVASGSLTPFSNFAEQSISPPPAYLGSNRNDRTSFSLTIEKLGIAKAKVVTGDNFTTQLAHLPGSASPGEVGNVFISGHSTLPQLFSPQNYWSIFSKLYLLEIGDQIILGHDNSNFIYQITGILVVKPSDIWVANPPDPYGVYLTLLTCGVGGFGQDRIILKATLADSQKLI